MIITILIILLSAETTAVVFQYKINEAQAQRIEKLEKRRDYGK